MGPVAGEGKTKNLIDDKTVSIGARREMGAGGGGDRTLQVSTWGENPLMYQQVNGVFAGKKRDQDACTPRKKEGTGSLKMTNEQSHGNDHREGASELKRKDRIGKGTPWGEVTQGLYGKKKRLRAIGVPKGGGNEEQPIGGRNITSTTLQGKKKKKKKQNVESG